MSSLKKAYVIPINSQNKDFVKYPYIPNRNDPKLMTIARCFDIKEGAKNSYAPMIPAKNNLL